MSALLWLSALLAELALAGGAAWLMTAAFAGSAGSLIALWIASFLCLQPLLVLVLFAIGRIAAGGAYGGLSARALAAESAALLFAALAMGRSGLRRSPREGPGARPDGPAAGSGTTRPLLLVHGILCNGAIWRWVRRRLAAAGFSHVRSVELHPILADIETHASHVAREALAMQRECGGVRVTIIGHSMGGLVARAALRKVGATVVSRVLTLATPHHGTVIARFLPFAPMRQMCPGSRWLRRLNADQEGRLEVPLTSLYSLEDALVAPPRSAELAGARLVPLRGLGHLSVVASPRALDRLLGELAQDSCT